jgi:Tol biopolymer transport system component
MTRPRPFTACLLAALACGASATAAPAGADVFGPISLASESPVQQADYAHDPAISGDGRYVAFDGSFGGASGVWRRDLQTGAVEAVAGGDAQRPSISHDGRYISFTTTAPLTGADQNGAPDVYVRDMSVGTAVACTATGQPCGFELASALDGGEAALSYASSTEAPGYGSLAAGRYALSADGRKVAFVTTAVSDLAGPRAPLAPTTPAMQLAVRDLDTHATQLVTTTLPASVETHPVSSQEGAETYGGVYAVGGKPPRFEAISAYEPTPSAGAAISADGTTVAWLGVNIARQAAVLGGESQVPRYAEPLWRRISDGPLAPTRRISGGSDPLSPACAASGETTLTTPVSLADPCQGPFSTQAEATSPGVWTGGIGDTVPLLSGDGYTVAFLANAPLVAFGSNFGRTENNSDVYVADMHPGLTRVQALRPLSQLAGGQSSDVASNSPIVDLAISADGRQVAFTTKRTIFPLGAPGYVSPPDAVAGMAELFSADLADETLTRVTRSFQGGASAHPHATVPVGQDPYGAAGDGALSPSYSSDGEMLAFSSTADNLVFGDGNTPPLGSGGITFDGSDAFVVHRVVFSSSPPEAAISAAPALPELTQPWRLLAWAKSHRDGSVTLTLLLPGAGTIQVSARGHVRGGVARRRGRLQSKLASRVVAAKLSTASTAGKLEVTLRLRPRYLSLAGARRGFPALLSVTFSAPGHPVLHARLEARFVQLARSAKGMRAR